MLSLVRSSPALVAAHDKAGWLGIFAREHVVEDPVGAQPVRSQDAGALERFWDTFIAPNRIEFEVTHDWVDGLDVVREATIVSTLRPGVVVRTPAHLIYQTTYEDGTLKVRRMAAYWEPRPVYRQMMRPTGAHVAAGLRQFAHMFRTLGVGPSLHFVGAARHVKWRRKRALLQELERQGVRDVSRLIAAGDSGTATGLRNGAPVAAIARFAPRSTTVHEMQVYEDLA